jgi:regulatory protein
MPQISDIKPQKHNPNRLNIYIDGEFAFGVERLVAAWLSIGDEVDRNKIEALLQKDEMERAYLRALRLINIRPRSIWEISTRLEKAGYGESVIVSIIDRLQSSGLVSDPEFARTWVENRCSFRPRSKRILVLELHQKGIADSEIQSAVSDLDEATLALQTAEKYASRCKDMPFDEFRKKMFGYLTRRGFGFGTVAEAIQTTWQTLQVEAETLN